MEISTKIPSSVIQAATAMLTPYVPEIGAQSFVQALTEYKAVGRAANIEKPMTRKDAAELLGVSIPTINRLMNCGQLQRVKISRKCVRITAASVRSLLAASAAVATPDAVEVVQGGAAEKGGEA